MLKILNKRHINKGESFSNRDVLVGVVKNKEQYEININNNFYHIPAKRLYLLDLPINYVALFKSEKSFDVAEAGVFVYGRVTKITKLKRCEITESPSLSDKEYYRIDVESWKKLKTPIKSQEISPVHILTTKYLLHNAKTVPELYMLSSQELKLYRRLYELCNTPNIRLFKKFTHRGIKIGFSREFIEVIYPNTEHRRYNRRSFYKRPYLLFKFINAH